jgi:hypothetical protein
LSEPTEESSRPSIAALFRSGRNAFPRTNGRAQHITLREYATAIFVRQEQTNPEYSAREKRAEAKAVLDAVSTKNTNPTKAHIQYSARLRFSKFATATPDSRSSAQLIP